MALLVAAQVQTATGIADATGFVSPLFNQAEFVYAKAEYAGANIDYKLNPYKVLSMNWHTYDDSGTTRISGSVEGVEADDAVPTNTAWYYRVQNVESSRTFEFHEDLIQNVAATNTQRDAVEWTDPA